MASDAPSNDGLTNPTPTTREDLLMSRTELAAQARAVAARADSVHPVMLAPAAVLALVMITVAALAAVILLAAAVMTAGAAATLLCLDRGLRAATVWQPRRTNSGTTRAVPA